MQKTKIFPRFGKKVYQNGVFLWWTLLVTGFVA